MCWHVLLEVRAATDLIRTATSQDNLPDPRRSEGGRRLDEDHNLAQQNLIWDHVGQIRRHRSSWKKTKRFKKNWGLDNFPSLNFLPWRKIGNDRKCCGSHLCWIARTHKPGVFQPAYVVWTINYFNFNFWTWLLIIVPDFVLLSWQSLDSQKWGQSLCFTRRINRVLVFPPMHVSSPSNVAIKLNVTHNTQPELHQWDKLKSLLPL